jgi:predicted RND superfamily exporter protein
MNSFNISILTVFCIYFFYKFFKRKTHIDTEEIIDNDDKEDIFDNDDTTEKNIVIHENKYGKYIIVIVILVFVMVSIFFMVKKKEEKNDFIEKKENKIRTKYDEILSKSGGEPQQQIRVKKKYLDMFKDLKLDQSGEIRRQYKQPQQQMNSLDYAKYRRKIRNLRLRRFKEEKKRTKKMEQREKKKYAKKNQVRNKQNEAKSQQNKNEVNQNQTMQQRIQRILGRKVY